MAHITPERFPLPSTMPSWPSELSDCALGAYLDSRWATHSAPTVEFMTPAEIHQRYGTHQNIVGGGWLKACARGRTDDTTLVARARPGDRQASAMGYAVGGQRVRLVAACATDRLRQYLPARHPALHRRRQLAGRPNEGDAGNGALMRNLPVALATLGDDARFERWTLGAMPLHPPPSAVGRRHARRSCRIVSLAAAGRRAGRAARDRALAGQRAPGFSIRALPRPGPAATWSTQCRPCCTTSLSRATSRRA